LISILLSLLYASLLYSKTGDSSPYPPPGFPPPPPSVVYNHTHSAAPPPGYQGYYYEGYPSPSPGLPPPPLPPRNDYNYHNGCTSFLTGCLATLCCCCLLEDCIF
ncbi:cysteine-rich and transmembrane domain-containing protein WIH2-like, partial [Hibiscus syriacus]|uniref:cysteine-rich and transmembrane domain-containing protein WIH2-like n=1 Tax=Hibiscus syriacus TaxID=106335 RepID=UPI0019227F61